MDPQIEPVLRSSIRTFLLIENRLLREALVRLFSKRADLLVVGESGHAEAKSHSVLDSECDVLVIDSLQKAWLPANIALESGGHASFRTVVLAMDSDEEQFLVSSLRRPARCLSKTRLQGPILLCASSSWSLSWPRVSQIRKLLLT